MQSRQRRRGALLSPLRPRTGRAAPSPSPAGGGMVNSAASSPTHPLSQFHPTNLSVEPPPPPDYLAGAVLQGLSRPIGGRLSWGVLKSLFLGAVSFGLLPILAWTPGFRAFVIAEQQQLLHLAQWVRQNSAHPLARQLESDAVELRPRTMI